MASTMPWQWLMKLRERKISRIIRRTTQSRVKVSYGLAMISVSEAGLLLFASLVMLMLGSVSMHLNVGYLIAFFLGSVMVLSCWAGYFNLDRIELAAADIEPVIEGQDAVMPVEVTSRWRRSGIFLAAPKDTGGFLGHVHLERKSGKKSSGDLARQRLEVTFNALKRGWQTAPRLRLLTNYPLGLWNIWILWSPPNRVLVLPKAEANAPGLPLGGIESEGRDQTLGDESASSLRPYMQGDSPRRLAWRTYAKTDGQVLATRLFEGSMGEGLILNAAMTGLADTEAQIRRLAAWIDQAATEGLSFSLNFGGHQIEAGAGEEHRRRCLIWLATFDAAGVNT